jgi:hypothetical protein
MSIGSASSENISLLRKEGLVGTRAATGGGPKLNSFESASVALKRLSGSLTEALFGPEFTLEEPSPSPEAPNNP